MGLLMTYSRFCVYLITEHSALQMQLVWMHKGSMSELKRLVTCP